MNYAMYLRKSRADLDAEAHGEGETLARHKKMLFELAEKMGLTVSDVYEEVVSGDSIDGRPQIQSLLRAIEKRMYTGVLCMDIDRLARGDTIDQGIIARAFRMSETKIITPKKVYDPNSEYDEEYFEFELFMARREFKIIGRRIQRGRIESAKEGRFIGSAPPYGYNKVKIKKDKGYTLEPNPAEAKVVQLVFEMYLKGDGKSVIAKKLDLMGIKPRSGKPWSSSTVANILKNPVYIGKVRWGYRKYTKELSDGSVIKHREKNENCVYVDGLHPPIVSESDFEQVQQTLKQRTTVPLKADLSLKNPLSGLVYCGKCGSAMTRLGENSRCRSATLKCSNRYCDTVASKLHLVEHAVLDFLDGWIEEYKINVEKNSPKLPESTLEIYKNNLSALSEELETVKKQIDKTYDLLEQGIYTADIFRERSAALTAKREETERKISEVQDEIAKYRENVAIRENFIPHFERVLAVYRVSADTAEKNRLLKTVVRRITYTKDVRNTRRNPDAASFNLRIEPNVKE
ncbi:MAG: recombinase family protein [Lachnospiraceae bacterium]|nr:recombinase family protein [Ruminococcus sp.]MCM1276226.1 recombinase family protein [Lachnospiraceae bacterium]